MEKYIKPHGMAAIEAELATATTTVIVMNPNAQKWLIRNWKAALKAGTEYQWGQLEEALHALECCAPTDEERREYAFLGHLALTHLLRARGGV